MAATYAETSIGYDGTFALNEFNQPKLSSEIETVKNVLLFILFAKPGQYPSLPYIGLNLQEMLYSFYDEINETDLKNKCCEQCKMLGVYIQNNVIDFKKTIYQGKPSLMIHIEGTETYPNGYMADKVGNSTKYLIGITLNDINEMIYNTNKEGGY